MIGNSGDKILMLAVVDNVHGMHMHSLPMSGSWRGSHTWIVVAAMPYVCLSTLWKVEGWQRARIGRLSNLYRRTPVMGKPVVGIEPVPNFEIIFNLDMCLCISALAHIGESVSLKAHDVKRANTRYHQTVVDAVNGTSMRQQLIVETIAEVKAVADMHQRKAETAKHSDNNR
ncbi:hypothetical protein Tco_1411965 [Tanacetum coccineum]